MMRFESWCHVKKFFCLAVAVCLCLGTVAHASDFESALSTDESGGDNSILEPAPEPPTVTLPIAPPDPAPVVPDTPDVPDAPADPPADDVPDTPDTPDGSEDLPSDVESPADTVPGDGPDSDTSVPSDAVDGEGADLIPSEEWEFYAVEETPPGYSTYTLDDTTPAYDSGTMASAVIALFGEYQPKTQTVTDHLSDGTSVSYQQYVPGAAGVDWQWVAGVVLFAVVVWCFFKLVGVVLKHG